MISMHNKITYNSNTTQSRNCLLDIQNHFYFYATKHFHNIFFHHNCFYNTLPKHHNYQKLFGPQSTIAKTIAIAKLKLPQTGPVSQTNRDLNNYFSQFYGKQVYTWPLYPYVLVWWEYARTVDFISLSYKVFTFYLQNRDTYAVVWPGC